MAVSEPTDNDKIRQASLPEGLNVHAGQPKPKSIFGLEPEPPSLIEKIQVAAEEVFDRRKAEERKEAEERRAKAIQKAEQEKLAEEARNSEEVEKVEESVKMQSFEIFNTKLHNFFNVEKQFWDGIEEKEVNYLENKDLLFSHFNLAVRTIEKLIISIQSCVPVLGRNICSIIENGLKIFKNLAEFVADSLNKEETDDQKLLIALDNYNYFRIEKFGDFTGVIRILNTDTFAKHSLEGNYEQGVTKELKGAFSSLRGYFDKKITKELFDALKIPAIPESLLLEFKTQNDNGKLDFSDFPQKYEAALRNNIETNESVLRWRVFELLLPSAGENRVSADFVGKIYDAIKKSKKESSN